jgi:hypothetical protein
MNFCPKDCKTCNAVQFSQAGFPVRLVPLETPSLTKE